MNKYGDRLGLKYNCMTLMHVEMYVLNVYWYLTRNVFVTKTQNKTPHFIHKFINAIIKRVFLNRFISGYVGISFC